jgi:hypothetical protein
MPVPCPQHRVARLVRRSGLSAVWARRPQPDQAGAACATDDDAGSASHVKPSNAQLDVSLATMDLKA